PAGLGSLRVGHTLYGARGLFANSRALDECLGCGLLGIMGIHIGPVGGKLLWLRQTAPTVLGNHARHGDSTLDKSRKRIAVEIRGRDHCLATADQDAQTEIDALLSLEPLQLTQPLTVGDGGGAQKYSVGCFGSCLGRPLDQLFRQSRIGGCDAFRILSHPIPRQKGLGTKTADVTTAGVKRTRPCYSGSFCSHLSKSRS